ncbi:DUF953 domain-containing protein [Chitinophaga pendula]|uniref:thioredoxin domain-containing protein n=1 Tax=Chitinophaga TaxID=79328 RepID=UPI000BAF6A15|nr:MULTISPECIES: thioredoxin domain-containing protein [Chitinophaga]ASZ14623.1 hypothetical protein CK934_28550 [Chitinophaga sp. MD30]UCJ07726.1 DUF953 domain-containing protein [Chitinophaga pendula]
MKTGKCVWLLCILLSMHFATIAQDKKSAVDVETFEEGMQQPGVQIFDVRTAAEFNTGHLPNALQADYKKPDEFKTRVAALDKDKPVYIYCLAGARSADAAKTLRDNGFKEVVELKGGINAWKQAGKSLDGVKQQEPEQSPETFEKALNTSQLVLVDVGASWCPPCRKMDPVVQKYLQAHKEVKLVKVDGGRDQTIMKSLHVTTLPTFIFYRDGKEIGRKEGIVPATDFDNAFRQ